MITDSLKLFDKLIAIPFNSRELTRALQGCRDIIIYCSAHKHNCKECEIKHLIECDGELGRCSNPADWGYYNSLNR